MSYPVAAVERAMTIHQAIRHALHGRQTWLQVADVLGLSPRTVRRWRWKFERDGVKGLLDRRRQTPSTRRVPVAELQRVLRLYRERYPGFNVRHFHQLAQRDHGVTFSYTLVKAALQQAGLVRRARARGRHRRRREPRPCFGELLHLDGSRHRWLALVPETWHTLLVVVADATTHVLYAQLGDGGESTRAIMTALSAVFARHGLPGALYTDRAHWAVHTATSGSAPDRTRLTQVGSATPRRPAGAANAPTARCRIGWSTSSASPGSGPSRPPIATSRSASSPRTTRPSAARPPTRIRPSCLSPRLSSSPSSAMRRRASSPGTTP